MILVDTSVWIDHFRRALPALVRALENGDVLLHPFIVGELAVGQLRHREETIGLLLELPALPAAEHSKVLQFVERHGLAATGVGWIDAHLLCAAADGGVRLWTHDRSLRRQAARLGVLHAAA